MITIPPIITDVDKLSNHILHLITLVTEPSFEIYAQNKRFSAHSLKLLQEFICEEVIDPQKYIKNLVSRVRVEKEPSLHLNFYRLQITIHPVTRLSCEFVLWQASKYDKKIEVNFYLSEPMVQRVTISTTVYMHHSKEDVFDNIHTIQSK